MALVGARKKQRLKLIVAGGVALAAAAGLAGYAFNDAIVFFHPPTELIAKANAGEISETRRLRLGGLVQDGSVVEENDGAVSFVVTDLEQTVPVRFDGVLPSLFREGQGVVAEGYYKSGKFEASKVLAKHDEAYMPKEVAESLKKSGQWKAAPE